ncbi:MAG: hypothetical protein R3F46_06645 [bacterium]
MRASRKKGLFKANDCRRRSDKRGLAFYAGLASDSEDVPETTDPDAVRLANKKTLEAKYDVFWMGFTAFWKVAWSIVIFVVFIGLIHYEKCFIDMILARQEDLEKEQLLIFYSSTWIGFVVQVVGVVVVAVKHFFPDKN